VPSSQTTSSREESGALACERSSSSCAVPCASSGPLKAHGSAYRNDGSILARSSDMRHIAFLRYDSTKNMPGGPISRMVAWLELSRERDHLSVASCAFSVARWWSLVRVM
jgi:hypothetical protein